MPLRTLSIGIANSPSSTNSKLFLKKKKNHKDKKRSALQVDFSGGLFSFNTAEMVTNIQESWLQMFGPVE